MVAKLKKIAHFLLAVLAYWFYGRPARNLIVIGVTGTKGKSTTCRFIASVLEAAGYKVGLLSTVEFQIGTERIANKHQMTMLGRGKIQYFLKEMVKAGCRYAVVETSSEGILQYRHLGLLYDIAVFTNLGTEHQERHGGFENLKRDKGKLFAALGKRPHKIINGKKVPTAIIVNADDANADYYLSFPADEKWVFSTTEKNNLAPKIRSVRGENIAWSESRDQVNFEVAGKSYRIALVGNFNVYNALAAVACGFSQGVSADAIVTGLSNVQQVPGRMEFIEAGQPFKVVVDYAHEPMSLTELFQTLRVLVPDHGKLIGVIGSDGGGRDKQKRFRMGEIAGRLCDIVIVTDVNPWDEDPHAIAEMLAVGARQAGKIAGKSLFIIIDRRDAIRHAFTLAKNTGIVAITAKGTESSIVKQGGKRIPWDDRKVARELLTARTTANTPLRGSAVAGRGV